MSVEELLETEDIEAKKVERYEFDHFFQAKIAALMLRDTQFAQLTDGLIRPEYFENVAMSAVVAMANRYYARYKKAPGDSSIIASVLRDAIRDRFIPSEVVKLVAKELPDLLKMDVSDREYVADQCAEFARHQAIAKAVLDSIELISKRDFDTVGAKVKKALEVGVTAGSGTYSYADMIEARTRTRIDRAAGVLPPSGITTGYAILDGHLYHKGWGRRELSVLMGPPKAGKSMALIGFGINASAAGYRTLYVTLEVASDIIAQRIDANVSERAMNELELAPHEVQAKVIEFMGKAAPFDIEEFPTGAMRVADLARLIEKQKSIGNIYDLVIVDYADLMRPERVTDNVQENSKSVYTDLRALAQREGFALLTATQTNRDGAKKAVATMTDVAEDINKVRLADVLISINVTAEERAMNQARLFFAASRNQRSGFSLRIESNIDQAKFIVKVLGEE